MEEWLRGLAAIVAGVAIAMSGWLLKVASDLDKRVTVLEQQPRIDPVEQAKAMTELAMSIAQLTVQLADNNRARHEQYSEMKQMHVDFRKELDEVRSDVKLLVAMRQQAGGPGR